MKISISKISLFKSCRRAYFFKYVEGLEPVQKAEALETGLYYHELIESLYKCDGDISMFEWEEDYSKEQAMAMAYLKYVFPKVKIAKAEQWVEYSLGGSDELIGRVDGVTVDGMLVEHKTCSQEINEQYEYNLQWNEQILAYMLATGVRKMIYTVCRKPTIRQKQTETEEEFFKRMIDWYDEDTDSKIKVLTITRTDEEIEDFKLQLKDMVKIMTACKTYYRNSGWCNVWGRRCEYSSICLNYDSEQQYIEFKKSERGTENGN